MKKTLRFLCCSLCCVLLFSACNRVEQTPSDPVVSDASATPLGPDKDGYWDIDDLVQADVVFPIDGLYGESAESLVQSDSRAIIPVRMAGIQSTSVNVIFYSGGTGIPYLYDKRTGAFSLACRDPLCTHTYDDCIWANCVRFLCGRNAVYFLCSDDTDFDTLYRTDPYGENPQKIYQSDGDQIAYPLVEADDFLYFCAYQYDAETDQILQSCLMRIPTNGGRAEKITDDLSLHYLPMQDKVLYSSKEDNNAYLLSVETGERSLFDSSAYPIALYRDWIYYRKDEGGFYRASANNPADREKVLDHYSGVSPAFCGERIYYLETTLYSQSESFGNYYKYDLYSANLDGSDPTHIRTFETDGIPDRVADILINENMLFIWYKTYKDFQNEFNPKGEREPYRHAIVDLSSGESLAFKNQ